MLSMGETLFRIVLGYGIIGALVALLFTFGALTLRDPVYQDTRIRVRLIFIPGFVLLWPMMLSKRVGRENSGGDPS